MYICIIERSKDYERSPLVINKSSNRLYSYLKVRPHKQFTMLDCHDGIPVKPDLDDLVETVIINLKRGTGWRGLAPLDSEGTYRIFLSDLSF